MKMFRFVEKTLFTCAFLALYSTAYAAELLMVEQHDCPFCERFLAEIGPIYPKTEEGKLAPLLRVNLSDPLEDQYELLKPVSYTPTFILIEDGAEIDRLTGYRGDEHFWFLLGEMLEKIKQ